MTGGSSRRSRVARFALAGVVALGVGTQTSTPVGSATAQPSSQPSTTFRTQTTLVELDVRVADREGNFVSDLAVDDFEVLVDGRPQPITAFDLVRMQTDATTAPPTDVATNDRGDQEGRVYVLVLDDLQTHPSRSETVRVAARRFVQRSVGPFDRAAVVRTSGVTRGSQDFTSNRERLTDAIAQFVGQRLPQRVVPVPSPSGGQVGASPPSPPSLTPTPFPGSRNVNDEEAQNALTVFRGLQRWVAWLAGLSGRRKAVVLFSEGTSYDTSDVFRNVDASQIEDLMRDTIGTAARNNVAIYAIDPRGLPTGKPGPVPVIPDEDYFTRETLLAKMSLRSLADETGGFAFTNSNDFDGAFERIVRESSSYYLLGFEPPSSDIRAVHRIAVRVRREDVRVQSRRSYVSASIAERAAPAPSLSNRLDDLLRQALPQSGLTMAVHAIPFRTPSQPNAVAVVVELSSDRRPEIERATTPVALRLLAVGKDGHVRDTRSMILNMPTAGDLHVRAVSQMTLRPGEYQLRVGAIAEELDREGAVHYDLVVPDLRRKPIAISGPLLSSQAASDVATAFLPADLAKALDFVPSTARSYRADDVLVVLNHVYMNQSSARTPAALTIRIENATGESVATFREELSSPSTSERLPIVTRLPLGERSPGEYRVVVDVQGGGEARSAYKRQVSFRVVQ
jgi:VWFA-related protein